ncbi:MAG: DUF2442 domain-containing protein [Phycisphaerales bacterium]
MQPRVIECRPEADFKVWLRFEDGAAGVVDLSDLVGVGVFARWRTPGEFERVFIDPDTSTLAWPGGIDLDPYRLHSDIAGSALPGQSSQGVAA